MSFAGSWIAGFRLPDGAWRSGLLVVQYSAGFP